MMTETWHQKPFAFTGDIVGDQMPQRMQLPEQALDLLPGAVKVAKLTEQLATLKNNDVHTLGLVAATADATLFDEVKTRFSMYVPHKYPPLLIAPCMIPKEALFTINYQGASQNEQDTF
jgi:hypothetical protein